jgi:hypothetical protein
MYGFLNGTSSPSPHTFVTFLISFSNDKERLEPGSGRSKPTAAPLHSKIKSPLIGLN